MQACDKYLAVKSVGMARLPHAYIWFTVSEIIIQNGGISCRLCFVGVGEDRLADKIGKALQEDSFVS